MLIPCSAVLATPAPHSHLSNDCGIADVQFHCQAGPGTTATRALQDEAERDGAISADVVSVKVQARQRRKRSEAWVKCGCAQRYNGIGGDGAAALGPHFAALSSLQSLLLNNKRIGDDGAAALGPPLWRSHGCTA